MRTLFLWQFGRFAQQAFKMMRYVLRIASALTVLLVLSGGASPKPLQLPSSGNGLLVFPQASVSLLRTSPNNSLSVNPIKLRIHDTDMTFHIERSGKIMLPDDTSDILSEASQDIRHQILHYGRDTVLEEDYYYRFRSLRLVAWSHEQRETKYEVTYGMVSDMISGLRVTIGQLGHRECTVELARVVGDRVFPAGWGLLAFVTGPRVSGRKVAIGGKIQYSLVYRIGRR